MNKRIIANYAVDLFYCKVKNRIKKGVKARRRTWLYHNDIIEDDGQTHRLIKTIINGNEPAMVARYGFTEGSLLGLQVLKDNCGIKREYEKTYNMLYDTAGFFSEGGGREETDVAKFCNVMKKSSEYVDILGINYSILEEYAVNNYCKKAQLVNFDALGILSAKNSWGSALKGKKVLIIHPFANTIQKQYQRRDKIWGDDCETILPQFELVTYKAIQTIAGNNTEKYRDWFEALEIMKEDIKEIDFEIAILGCGAYGFPLAAEIKREGKKAVHLGGQTQVMFGILGGRYKNNPFYKRYINEYWVHPSKEETPTNYMNVEKGCYW